MGPCAGPSRVLGVRGSCSVVPCLAASALAVSLARPSTWAPPLALCPGLRAPLPCAVDGAGGSEEGQERGGRGTRGGLFRAPARPGLVCLVPSSQREPPQQEESIRRRSVVSPGGRERLNCPPRSRRVSPQATLEIMPAPWSYTCLWAPGHPKMPTPGGTAGTKAEPVGGPGSGMFHRHGPRKARSLGPASAAPGRRPHPWPSPCGACDSGP